MLRPTVATAVQKELDMWFKRTCEMAGDDLLVASDCEVFKWVEERSSKRSSALPSNYRELPMSEYFQALVFPPNMLN